MAGRRNRSSKYANKVQAKSLSVWIFTVIFSIIYCFGGYKFATKDLGLFNISEAYCVKAEVVELGEFVEDSYIADMTTTYTSGTLYFKAKVLTDKQWKGQIVTASQTFDNYSYYTSDEGVKPGDKVILFNYGSYAEDAADWVFSSYERLSGVEYLFAAFVALLILFGGIKGVNTIVSLGFTCLAVFMVFVPSVLAGCNIYLMSLITCVFITVMTLLITNGAGIKSLTTILGCCFGVAVAAGLSVFFDKYLRLTGILDEHSVYLQILGNGVELNLRAMIFGMIVIGAMGAVMDVAMDISSSLNEIHRHAEHLSFKELFKSGMTIGKDVMGTMANTLVLAYIGSSLCSILLYIQYSSSLFELLNRENIVVELLQALIGSMAILLAIPLTTLVCCAFYTDN